MKKRRKEMSAWATEHDFQIHEDTPRSLPLIEDQEMGLFRNGGSPTYRTVMSRTLDGREEYIFDFTYVISSGKSSQTVWRTVCAFRIKNITLPSFSMSPENFFHKIGSKLGYQDIDFKDSPKFSSNYLLRGKDESAIRESFGLSVMDYFGANKDWYMDGSGEWLFLYRQAGWMSGRFGVDKLIDYHKETRRIFEYFLEGFPVDGD